MFFAMYLIIGALAGILAGLLGLGGGIIVVPALAAVFLHYHLVPSEHVMHVAIATSLTTVVVTFLSSLRTHIRHGSVRWDYVKLLLPGIILGVVVGTFISDQLPSNYLRLFFSLFLFFMAYRLLFVNADLQLKSQPSNGLIRGVSAIIGMLSSVLGVGGGVVMVPFLLRCKLEMRAAAGTSVACGVVIGVLASLSYIFFAASPIHLPWSTGYVYWPAFLGVAISSTLFAPIGISIAHRLSETILKRILSTFLIAVGIDMLIPT